MIDQYKQAFVDEARELLTELESALLELNRNPGDGELVGRAFRALHTIKGSGAMFGFEDIAGFVHNLENAFDQLRNGKLTVTAALINLTLSAGDQIKNMLDEAAGRGAADRNRSVSILAELYLLTGSAGAQAADSSAPKAAVGAASGDPAQVWRIQFRPRPNILLNGANPVLMLRELRELGRVEIKLDAGSIPVLSQIAAECCYLAWDMVLTTSAPADAIRDVFIFVEEDCELTIERAPDQAAEAPAAAQAVQGSGAEGGPRRLFRSRRRAYGCRPRSSTTWSTWWASW